MKKNAQSNRDPKELTKGVADAQNMLSKMSEKMSPADLAQTFGGATAINMMDDLK